jgi:DNA-directed RNA polymerase subunit omega
VDLYNGFDSNYRYILVAARRARQLQSGAHPLVVPHRGAGTGSRQGEVADHAAAADRTA